MEQEATSYLKTADLLKHLSLAPGQWVGDFGVGSAAQLLLPIGQAIGPDGGVVMFDVQKTALSGAISIAKTNGLKNYRAVWTNLEMWQGAQSVADNSLDAGVLMNVIYQTTKPQDMLAEIHRVLKSGAKLLIVDWKQTAEMPLAPDAKIRKADAYVEQLAKSIGFAPFEQFEAGPYHWGLVLVKT